VKCQWLVSLVNYQKTAMLELLKSATCAKKIIKPTISPITASITTLTSATSATFDFFDHRKEVAIIKNAKQP
jgi:hypothetical protein